MQTTRYAPGTRRETPFSENDHDNAAKNSLCALVAAFVPPVYPSPRRAASVIVNGQGGWNIIGVLETNESLASTFRTVYEILEFVNCSIGLASTSVSTDVLLRGAPSLWHHYFSSAADYTLITPMDAIGNAYIDTFVQATYLEPADTQPRVIEAGEVFEEENESDVRVATLQALDRVQSFMGWTDEEMAGAGNFRRSSMYNWARGTRPQVAKVSGLLGIDAFLTSLRRQLGDEVARTWLDGGDGTRTLRLLRGESASVITEAESIIFPLVTLRSDEGYWGDASRVVAH